MELSTVFSNTPLRATIASSLHCKNRVSSSSSEGRRSIVLLPTNFYYMRHCRGIVPPSLFHLSINDIASHPLSGMFSLGRKNTTNASVNTRHPKQRIPIIQIYGRKNIHNSKKSTSRLSAIFQITDSLKRMEPKLQAYNKEIGTAGSHPVSNKFARLRDTVWRVTRPYAIQGHILGSFLVRDLIATPISISSSLLMKTFLGFVVLFVHNAYVVGINDLHDIDIDKINKPYLPIAAGELLVNHMWLLMILYTAIGVLIVGLTREPLIIAPFVASMFIGTIYSAPPFRLKRFPVGTLFCFVAGRLQIQLYSYYATRVVLGLRFQWSYPLAFQAIFSAVLCLCIMIFKDLPDVKGDQKFQISTWAIKYGVRNMAFRGYGIMLLNYIGAISAAVFAPQVFRRSVMIPACAIMALCFVYQAWRLDKTNYSEESLPNFYRFIWILHDAELILFPFMYK